LRIVLITRNALPGLVVELSKLTYDSSGLLSAQLIGPLATRDRRKSVTHRTLAG